MRVELDALAVEWRGRARSFRLGELTLEIGAGRILAIAGASGSGKSTLLDLVAGLRRPDAGSIRFDGRDVGRTPPERRDVALVTQDAALYDDETVARNLDLVLHARGVERRERAARIDSLLTSLDVGHLRDVGAGSCSGGERRRVALAKALARAPRVLLLDEPFAGLGPAQRRDVRTALRRALDACDPKPTVLIASHDVEDALVLADALAILDDGRIVQCAPPRDVLAKPATPAVAMAITDPPGTFVQVQLRLADVDPPRGTMLAVRGTGIDWMLNSRATSACEGSLLIPPDALVRDASADPLAAALVDWRVVDSEPRRHGHDLLLAHPADDRTLLRAFRGDGRPDVIPADDSAQWSVRLDRVHLFDAETGDRVPVLIESHRS